MKGGLITLGLLLLLLLTAGVALWAGRLSLPLSALLTALSDTTPSLARKLVLDIRLPRILLAALVGAGLAVAGAALQSLCRNPLAEPGLLGISSGAACGGVLMLISLGDGWPLTLGALLGGLLALWTVLALAGNAAQRNSDTLLLILAGIVVSSLFAAGVSLLKLLADPQNQLPGIVFWLMGSLAASDYGRLWIAIPVIGGGLLLLWLLRYPLMVLANFGAETPKLQRARYLALLAIGLIAAGSVAACGVVGWVGLVIPHLVRLAFGCHYRHFLLHTALAGASYLITVDTLARTVSPIEIPLGVLTALLGAPLFAALIWRIRRQP